MNAKKKTALNAQAFNQLIVREFRRFSRICLEASERCTTKRQRRRLRTLAVEMEARADLTQYCANGSCQL